MQETSTLKQVSGFELCWERDYDLINGTLRLWKHSASSAPVLQFDCDDTQKAFAIGFRTPPRVGDGVAHILEHSVLCGSKKFPGKEPFASLLRSSLQTFLNAMTYSDRTIYPFASVNEKDFLNILEVYLDAVFYPRIYDEPMIFAKEGHHLELDAEGNPFITGVVYNEMRGALSGAERLIFEKIDEELYDNAYGVNSGGNPAEIEGLSYEDFCAFHTNHYHPSNSFSFVYGDLDFAAVADKLAEYFDAFEPKSCNYVIPDAELFEEERSCLDYYPAASDEDKPIMSLSFLIDSERLSPADAFALNILRCLALDNSSSVLQQHLMDGGLSQASYSYLNTINHQPNLSFIFQEVDPSKKEELKSLVLEEFERIVKEGFNKEEIEAALNAAAFSIKEGNYDYLPKGLGLGLHAANALVFNEDIYEQLDCTGILEKLRAELVAENGYFEDLFSSVTLKNKSRLWVELEPKQGLLEQKAAQAKERARKAYERLSPEQQAEIVPFQEELAAYSVAPDKPEDEARIPKLEREDLSVEVPDYSVQQNAYGLYKEVESNGISYLNLMNQLVPTSDADKEIARQELAGKTEIATEELPLLFFLCTVLGSVGTKRYSFEELTTKRTALTGALRFYAPLYKKSEARAGNLTPDADPSHEYDERYLTLFTMSMSYLDEYKDEALELAHEVYFNSQVGDEKRVKQILESELARTKSELSELGDQLCKHRVNSYISSMGAYSEYADGYSQYESLKAFKELGVPELCRRLQELYTRILEGAGRFVYLAGTGDKGAELKEIVAQFECPEFIGRPSYTQAPCFPLGAKNEGLALQTEVNYVGVAGRFKKNYRMSGIMKVARTIVSIDYLWTHVRLEGGAYGCMHFENADRSSIVSYRDPQLAKTYENYEKIPAFLESLELGERELTDRIIATLGTEQSPRTPSQIQASSLVQFLTGQDQDCLRGVQEEILSCTLEDIKAMAEPYRTMLAHKVCCTAGSKESLEKASSFFKEIKELG